MTANADASLYSDLMRFMPDGMTPNAWAVRAGVSRTVWADMRRHGNPSRKTLEKLLAAADSTLAEFEALRLGEGPLVDPRNEVTGVGDALSPAWRAGPRSPLPLLSTSAAGEWGGLGSGIELIMLDRTIVVDRIARPDSLASDAHGYAVTVLGDAMWPRYRPGRRLIVSPRAPVAIGDDVLVELRHDNGQETTVTALIKELVRRSAGFLELRQYNPDIEFRVDAADISAIHKIVGEAF
ncbi:MAG: helix-turn-helix transcriptional regulator [Sphingomonas sp.]|uniref:S24 family peptidase n=1 Tax=Sphingomonas sp. TaxID=28214 RepID=UPI001855CBA3|nr:S24 family peptidase [Sphingomonas sp.]MBA3667316.1 helix-turn-helix transcriptional regulator [Sphingomonas sp.]